MIHFPHMILTGVLLILSGVAIRFRVGQRRFKRRNPFGMEIYSSYAKGVATRLLEGVANLFGRILILLGILLIIASAF